MVISTKNFHPDTDKKLKCTCGTPGCDQRSVRQEHLDRVQKVRDIVGHLLTITSGGRCGMHPDELHKAKPGDHFKGFAVDVGAYGATRGNIVKAGLDVGCNAIGIAKSFVHLGYRPELEDGEIVIVTGKPLK